MRLRLTLILYYYTVKFVLMKTIFTLHIYEKSFNYTSLKYYQCLWGYSKFITRSTHSKKSNINSHGIFSECFLLIKITIYKKSAVIKSLTCMFAFGLFLRLIKKWFVTRFYCSWFPWTLGPLWGNRDTSNVDWVHSEQKNGCHK